jgi:geranylgeranyl diphosphate synthase, type II
MDVHAYLAERIPLVDRFLDAFLPPADEAPRALHAAMRHLIFPGGKRLRPALAMAGAEAVGASPEAALPAAAAVELVHTYSLVHDDLPCMDDDVERRGRPTVHVAFGEAVAVLAGDALLAAAFEALTSAGSGVDPARVAAAVKDLAATAGSRWLVGGQVDDLGFARGAGGTPADAARIESVHERKSAALIRASVVNGARMGGADAPALGRLSRFGIEVGVAFQIADDVLDADQDDPCSTVRAIGLDAARERAEALLESALARLEGFGERAEPLRELARFAVRRDR